MSARTTALAPELAGLAIDAICDLDHPVKAATSEWARGALSRHDMVAADRESTFARDDWRACAERGIHGLLVDPAYGGRGADLFTALLTLEGLGHGCPDNGLTFAIASQIVSTQVAIDRFGSDEQKRRWLPGLCDGSLLGAFAITEPESGSDAHALAATAIEQPDGTFVLNGTKAHITLGSLADVVVVFASTDPDVGRWGLSAFIVPTGLDGVVLAGNREKMGMRTTPFGNIELHDAVVPADALIARQGAGASIFTATLEAERGFVFATQIGMMQRQLEATIEYASTRMQGGRPIGEHQAVSHRIADMKVRHETARLFLYRTALAVARGESATLAAAMSKLVASETALANGLDAGLNHGAAGYVTEHEIERDVRDAVGGLVYSGTSDIQRNIVSRLLGVG